MSVPQRIAVTGASGLIGTALIGHLKSEGHTVQKLVRRPVVSADEVSWVPQVTIDAAVAHPDTRFIGISQNMSDGPANATGLLFADDEVASFTEDLTGLIVEIHAGLAP